MTDDLERIRGRVIEDMTHESTYRAAQAQENLAAQARAQRLGAELAATGAPRCASLVSPIPLSASGAQLQVAEDARAIAEAEFVEEAFWKVCDTVYSI